MIELIHRAAPLAAPLAVVGLLTLVGCPGDDVPIDTDAASMGTTNGDSATGTIPTATLDDTGSDTTPATETGVECMPACDANECCISGSCFNAPQPDCGGACAPGEMCLCPPGSDPCDCIAECISCGVDSPIDPCIDVECPAGSVCVADDAEAPTVAVCAMQGCGDDPCACPLPASGTAVNACGSLPGDDGSGSCFLDCTDGTCPDQMLCRDIEGQLMCVWPGDDVLSDCCGPNGTPGCDVGSCQDAVCGADEFCCDTEWDQLCADATPSLCPGLCPAEGPWGDCINGFPCDAGLTCISNGQFGWCASIGCMDPGDCEAAPPTGDAMAGCEPILEMGETACVLDCSTGESCPDGMVCTGDFCVWQGPVQGYGNCGLSPCALGEDCLVDGDPKMMIDPTWAVCSVPGCADATACDYLLPATGDAPVACADPAGMGGPNTCYLDCAGGQTCPDGMGCTDGSFCAWPQGPTLFSDDFESGDLTTGGWTLADVDMQTPDIDVDFVDAAWVVSDLVDGGNFAAISTSYYDPVGQSDDWLISPQIAIGPNARVTWVSRSANGDFPDGFEVRISTATNATADFLANPELLSVPVEAVAYTLHVLDLAAAGYADQPIYLAWRNVTDNGELLLVDDVFVIELP